LPWIGHGRTGVGASIRIEAYEVQRRINDPEAVVFIEKSLLIGHARLYVVDALHVRDIRTNTCIGQRPVLAQGFLVKVRREIGERVGAWVIVELVPPDEST
jgi:hypothetical protein